MKLIRIKAYQPFACYHKPFSYGFWDTYPLPPFSTILGWVHWILGESEREDKLPMNIGVVGQFDSIAYDLQTLIKFDRKRNKPGEIILEDFNKALSSTPTYVANIINLYLRIYIQMESHYLEKFKKRALHVNYPSLGRYEDLMRIDDIELIMAEETQIGGFDDPISIEYGIYLKPQTSKATGIKGSNFQLPFYYQQINGIRFFEKENVVFTDAGNIDTGRYFVDKEIDDKFDTPVLIELFGKYSHALDEVLR